MQTEAHALTNTEESSFSQHMADSYRKVYNMAYRLAGNRADAEDLTQESFFRAYRAYHEFEGDKPFENWIYRILSRLFLDLLRARRRRVRTVSYDTPIPNGFSDDSLYFDVADHSPDPEERLMTGALSEDLQKVMNSLSAEQRLLVNLADVENVPYQEIAEMLGKPVGTVRSRLHRTHKLIRSRLESLRRQTGANAPAVQNRRSFGPGRLSPAM